LLAEIDPRPFEATLAQANGNLVRDQALLKGAQVDLTRYQGLAAQNAVPRQTLDTQVALVAQYLGTVEADRATVKSAEVNLQYCRILSPLDGRVGLRLVDQGNYVTPGDATGLVVITQLQPISVLFTIPEDNLQAIAKRIQAGAVLPANAYDRSGSNKIADGTLLASDSQIDPTTGTIKLRAQYANEKKLLFPNQFVNVRLLLDTHKDVTTMPTAGVQRGVPGTFVYLVNADNTVSVRKVVLGVTDGDRVEVNSGLVPGDRVVIDGADKLRDGAKINVRAEVPAGAPPAAGTPPAGAPPVDSEKSGKKRRSDSGQKQ
jgi:multidrug efflux system membrane fusion protein